MGNCLPPLFYRREAKRGCFPPLLYCREAKGGCFPPLFYCRKAKWGCFPPLFYCRAAAIFLSAFVACLCAILQTLHAVSSSMMSDVKNLVHTERFYMNKNEMNAVNKKKMTENKLKRRNQMLNEENDAKRCEPTCSKLNETNPDEASPCESASCK